MDVRDWMLVMGYLSLDPVEWTGLDASDWTPKIRGYRTDIW